MILSALGLGPHGFVSGAGSQAYPKRVILCKGTDHTFKSRLWALHKRCGTKSLPCSQLTRALSEAQSMDKDIEDAWFQTSHPFHQSSSHELISMFSPSSEGKMKSHDFHCPYPKLPSSVSRSRGKHYRSRKWKRGEHEVISLDKQHPIRQASGVEVKDGALLKDRKSSLSKSSIGSSDNPGCDPENTNLRANKGASKIRKSTNTVQITSNKRNSSNVYKTTSSGRLQDSSNLMLKRGGKVATTKLDYRDSKAKILLSPAPRKPLWSHNVADPLKERVTTKSKNDVSSSKFNRAAGGGGKEK